MRWINRLAQQSLIGITRDALHARAFGPTHGLGGATVLWLVWAADLDRIPALQDPSDPSDPSDSSTHRRGKWRSRVRLYPRGGTRQLSFSFFRPAWKLAIQPIATSDLGRGSRPNSPHVTRDASTILRSHGSSARAIAALRTSAHVAIQRALAGQYGTVQACSVGEGPITALHQSRKMPTSPSRPPG